MPLKLVPIAQSEYIIYLQIAWEAFRPGIMEVFFPDGQTAASQQHSVDAITRRVLRYPGRTHFRKVIDTDLPHDDPFGQVAGVSQWQIYPHDRTEEEMKQEAEEAKRDKEQFGPTPGANMKVRQEFASISSEYEERYVGRSAHVHLQAIGTRPECERKGVAALALAWGTQKADELGLPAYLEGSKKGVELYKRWGFEELGTMPFDATQYGYHDPLTHVYMRRLPRKAE